ncbi:MAG: hypothetical protein NTY09_01035 [bacterium]|nr:hypothetical protein [bacterium]
MKRFPVKSAAVGVVFGMFAVFFIAPVIAQEGADEWEPNDNRLLADEITGFSINGEIGEVETLDTEDWYVLTGQQGNPTEFVITFNSDELDLDVEIYSGELLIATLSESAESRVIEAEVPDPCFIRVLAISGAGIYEIDINPLDEAVLCQGKSEVEPNNEKSHANIIDQPIIEGYACMGDDDWFRLDGFEGDSLTLTLTYDEETCDIDCLVYSGVTLLGVMDGRSSPDSSDFQIAGDVYLYVYAFEGEGGYSIEIGS